jgi:hypothetical protein
MPKRFVLAVLFLTLGASASQNETRSNAAFACTASGTAYTRTTLYFGLARPAGTISRKEWKAFVAEEVTPRFPQGFTTWEAQGSGKVKTGRSRGNVPRSCCLCTRTRPLFAMPSLH